MALFRMFDRWRRSFEDGQPLHQVFVTVSATLKEQVCGCGGAVGSQDGVAVRPLSRPCFFSGALLFLWHSCRTARHSLLPSPSSPPEVPPYRWPRRLCG